MIIRGAPGNKKVFRQIKDIPRSFKVGMSKANDNIGPQIVKTARFFVKTPPKSGEWYRLWDRLLRIRRWHQASAWGESPAIFTGSLNASMGSVNQGDQLTIGAGGTVVFGRLINYAEKLEVKFNRPYLIKAVRSKQKDAENYYYLEITKRLRG